MDTMDTPVYNSAPDTAPDSWIPENVSSVMENVSGTVVEPPPFQYPGLQAFSLEYAKYHGYIAAVVCVWGICANIANIVVLTRRNMRSSTNLILMWLAVADLLTMTSYFPVSIHFYIMKHPDLAFPSSTSQFWIYFMLFHINFTVVCHTIAIWLTICLAIFRYLYICYPTKGQQLCSLERARLCVIAVCLSTTVICVPNYMCTGVKPNYYFPDLPNGTAQNTTATTYYDFKETAISDPYIKKLNFWIHTFVFKLVPCALLTILTVLLIIAMHQAAQRRLKLKSQGKKDESDRAREHNRTTGMLLAVVGLFLLSELPQGVLTLCNIFIPGFYEQVYWPLGDLLDFGALLNNSINFVLYCTMSRQFRDTFTAVFCGCCPKQRPGWMKLKALHVSSSNGEAAAAAHHHVVTCPAGTRDTGTVTGV